MKLLFISAAFPPMRAGESEHAYHQCARLAERGVEVHLLTGQENAASLPVSFTVHPTMRDWSWGDLPRFVRILRRLRPDAVMLMYSGWIYNAHPMITFGPSIVRRVLPGVPFVTQMEIEAGETWRTPGMRFGRKIAQYLVGTSEVDYSFGTLLRDSTKVISLSEHHQSKHAALLPGLLEKSLVIPPPPLLNLCADGPTAARERGRKALGLKPEELLAVFFGYADKNKGIETLFKAMQIVKKETSRVRLAMIGGGRGSTTQAEDDRARSISSYEKEILALPDQLGIADAVSWLSGYDSNSDAASMYLYAADVCVLPFDQGVTLSRSSLAAALGHGLPVITTRGASLETPFCHGENVYLCPPKDPEALAAALTTLEASTELRAKLGQGAVVLSRAWFSWDTAVDRLLESLQLPV